MKHPLEFDGKCSNPNHWMFTGMNRKQRINYWLLAAGMYIAGWVVGGLVWILAMIDRRKYGLAHHQHRRGKWL